MLNKTSIGQSKREWERVISGDQAELKYNLSHIVCWAVPRINVWTKKKRYVGTSGKKLPVTIAKVRFLLGFESEALATAQLYIMCEGVIT